MKMSNEFIPLVPESLVNVCLSRRNTHADVEDYAGMEDVDYCDITGFPCEKSDCQVEDCPGCTMAEELCPECGINMVIASDVVFDIEAPFHFCPEPFHSGQEGL